MKVTQKDKNLFWAGYYARIASSNGISDPSECKKTMAILEGLDDSEKEEVLERWRERYEEMERETMLGKAKAIIERNGKEVPADYEEAISLAYDLENEERFGRRDSFMAYMNGN